MVLRLFPVFPRGVIVGIRLLSLLIYSIVRLFQASYRFRFDGERGVKAPPDAAHSILAIWHQNLFAGILAQTGRRHVVIASRSRDGDPVTRVCEGLGHAVCRGSSRKGNVDKGGKAAKDEMIGMLKGGLPGAVTVDGPRGPAFEVKPGIIEMARQTGLPIIPYYPLPRRYWSLGSWDAFRLPKPFTRIDVYYGAPIRVPLETEFAQFADFQQQIADGLKQLEIRHGGGDASRAAGPA